MDCVHQAALPEGSGNLGEQRQLFSACCVQPLVPEPSGPRAEGTGTSSVLGQKAVRDSARARCSGRLAGVRADTRLPGSEPSAVTDLRLVAPPLCPASASSTVLISSAVAEINELPHAT